MHTYIYNHIYIYTNHQDPIYRINLYVHLFWVNFITAEPCSPFFLESSPGGAELFRLVTYLNLPRLMAINGYYLPV